MTAADKPEQDAPDAVDDLKKKILAERDKGNVVFQMLPGEFYVANLDRFIEQPADGILYDLNRLEEVCLTFIDDPKWVNDFAAALTIRKLHATIAALREEVSRLTDNQRQQDSATAYVMERDEKERDALRQANKDCVDHFEVLKVDYDTLLLEVEELKPFKSAIDDQMIVLHLGTADTYPAKRCLDEIINWQVSISLDPQVSSDAATLRDTHLKRAEAAERELAALKRGEFICQRCGIRKDGEHDSQYEF